MIILTSSINPAPAKAMTAPIDAYIAVFLAWSILPGFPAEVTNWMPDTTNIKTANAPMTVDMYKVIPDIRL